MFSESGGHRRRQRLCELSGSAAKPVLRVRAILVSIRRLLLTPRCSVPASSTMAPPKVMAAVLEGCRAATLATHSAAGLVAGAKLDAIGPDVVEFVEATRLLRSAEALARSASAVIQDIVARNALRASGAAAGSAAPLDGGVTLDASTTGPAGKKKKKKKRVKKKEDESEEVLPLVAAGSAMDVDAASFVPGAVAAVTTGAVGGGPAVLAPEPVPLETQPSPHLIGATVLFFGLSSRKDLENMQASVISWSAQTARLGVKVATTDERILVRPNNVRASIFSQY